MRPTYQETIALLPSEKWFVTHSSLEEGSLIVVSVGGDWGGDNAGCSGIGLASLSKFSDYIGVGLL